MLQHSIQRVLEVAWNGCCNVACRTSWSLLKWMLQSNILEMDVTTWHPERLGSCLGRACWSLLLLCRLKAASAKVFGASDNAHRASCGPCVPTLRRFFRCLGAVLCRIGSLVFGSILLARQKRRTWLARIFAKPSMRVRIPPCVAGTLDTGAGSWLGAFWTPAGKSPYEKCANVYSSGDISTCTAESRCPPATGSTILTTHFPPFHVFCPYSVHDRSWPPLPTHPFPRFAATPNHFHPFALRARQKTMFASLPCDSRLNENPSMEDAFGKNDACLAPHYLSMSPILTLTSVNCSFVGL